MPREQDRNEEPSAFSQIAHVLERLDSGHKALEARMAQYSEQLGEGLVVVLNTLITLGASLAGLREQLVSMHRARVETASDTQAATEEGILKSILQIRESYSAGNGPTAYPDGSSSNPHSPESRDNNPWAALEELGYMWLRNVLADDERRDRLAHRLAPNSEACTTRIKELLTQLYDEGIIVNGEPRSPKSAR